MWVSALPVLLALIAGGYVGKFKAAGVEFDRGEQDLPYLRPGPKVPIEENINSSTEEKHPKASLHEVDELNLKEARVNRYRQNRDVFLVHKYKPSVHKGQRYDIFIYLIRHGSFDFSDVEKAEFFFGEAWGDRTFMAEKVGELIGVSTSAWGTFLAICLVTFRDGHKVIMHRYIDFEMAATGT